MTRSIIVAKSQNNVIGVNNTLPWYLPADLKRFKQITTGHTVIMGRKTFDSIGKALPNRTNIVITRNKNLVYPDCIMCGSLDEAFKIAEENGETEAFLIGGAELIKEGIDLCDVIYLTDIFSEFKGDTFIDNLNDKRWKLFSSEVNEPDEKNLYTYTFEIYTKIPERILCASIHFDDGNTYLYQPTNITSGLVFSGYRHCSIYQLLRMNVKERNDLFIFEKEQGFLTNFNRFVTREEGAIIAYKAGQIKEETIRLYSEDLY